MRPAPEMRHASASQRSCALVLCLGLTAFATAFATACASDSAHDGGRPEGEMSTDIGRPLAAVNAAVLAAAESCGLRIDTRRFVEGLVVLEGTLQDGERVRLELEARDPASTALTVSAIGSVSDAQLVQLLHAIRSKVWN